MPTYWVSIQDGEPENLYRHTPGRVEVWHQGEWQVVPLTLFDLEGLGGDTNYRQVAEGSIERVFAMFDPDPIVTCEGFMPGGRVDTDQTNEDGL
jgi:hypothetical protein